MEVWRLEAWRLEVLDFGGSTRVCLRGAGGFISLFFSNYVISCSSISFLPRASDRSAVVIIAHVIVVLIDVIMIVVSKMAGVVLMMVILVIWVPIFTELAPGHKLVL